VLPETKPYQCFGGDFRNVPNFYKLLLNDLDGPLVLSSAYSKLHLSEVHACWTRHGVYSIEAKTAI
jgi:hypothetical protein